MDELREEYLAEKFDIEINTFLKSLVTTHVIPSVVRNLVWDCFVAVLLAMTVSSYNL